MISLNNGLEGRSYDLSKVIRAVRFLYVGYFYKFTFRCIFLGKMNKCLDLYHFNASSRYTFINVCHWSNYLLTKTSVRKICIFCFWIYTTNLRKQSWYYYCTHLTSLESEFKVKYELTFGLHGPYLAYQFVRWHLIKTAACVMALYIVKLTNSLKKRHKLWTYEIEVISSYVTLSRVLELGGINHQNNNYSFQSSLNTKHIANFIISVSEDGNTCANLLFTDPLWQHNSSLRV